MDVTAASWPTVPGEVVESRLGVGGKNSHRAEAKYTYEVGGEYYEGSQIAFGYPSTNTNRKQHTRIHEKLKAADTVLVRYNPNDPATATLSAGINSFHGIMISFPCGGLLLIVTAHTRSHVFDEKSKTPKALWTLCGALLLIFLWAMFVGDDRLADGIVVNPLVAG